MAGSSGRCGRPAAHHMGQCRPGLASERITIGVIGWGMMGPANTKAFLEQS